VVRRRAILRRFDELIEDVRNSFSLPVACPSGVRPVNHSATEVAAALLRSDLGHAPRARDVMPLNSSTAPIRVLHLLNDLKVGGGQQLVLFLAQHADRRRLQVSVAYVAAHHEMRPLFEAAGVVPTCLHHKSGRGVLTLVRLARLLRSEKIDVLHAHSHLDKRFAYAAAALTRVPVVSHLHMPRRPYGKRDERSIAARLRTRIRTSAERLVVARFVAASRAIRDSTAPYLPDPDRLELVYDGIPTARFRQAADPSQLQALRRELGVNGADPLLINVARLHPQKDLLSLVRAMPVVREARPEAKLLIVGEGEERGLLEQEIHERGLEETVLLIGARHDIPNLLAISDVFVLSSRHEGFGMVVAEAMAAGKPVVAFDLEPLREVVEDGQSGYLVKTRTPDALASAILRIVNDSSLARAMGERGKQIVLERFDISVTSRQLEAVYRSVVRGHSPSARDAERSVGESVTRDERSSLGASHAAPE
jgi:glycosyltransferase involved in cell wall biosynthesis